MSNGKVLGMSALVTGGTSGIGLEIVRQLAADGYAVFALARHEGDFRVSVEDLSACAGGTPRFIAGDVTNRKSLERARDFAAGQEYPLQTVVAAAGTAARSPALDASDDDIRMMLEVNLYGTFATFQVFAPLLLTLPRSRFIAIGSVSGKHGMQLRAMYGATKAGVSGLVRSLAIEWAPHGATVNAVGPGVVATPLTSGYMERFPERAQAVIENTPVGRLGTPADVAGLVSFLASPRADFITGQTIYSDGGFGVGSSWW
jgi:NAD(P)-dependent dehydrogenase (short-subunit alcohol dehydrogenase family)